MQAPIEVSPDQLLLDPNNYRFLDLDGFRKVAENGFHKSTVQDKAMDTLTSKEDLATLIDSIMANTYVPFEAMIVVEYEHVPDTYVVIEGNRRCAAIKQIITAYTDDNFDTPEAVLSSIRSIPVVVAPSDKKERRAFISTLMGIRHVSGVKEWGAYQQALLIQELRDVDHLAPKAAAQRVGLKVREATRRYRALKALQQMQADASYSDYAKPELYRLFHEAVETLDKWLEWNDDEFRFANAANLRLFYKWITAIPEEDEERADERPPKLRTYKDVRDLGRVVPNEDALAKLLEPEGTLSEALAEVETYQTPNWQPKVKTALRVLNDMASSTLKQLTQDELKLLEDIARVARERLDDRFALVQQPVEE